jgi:hypothetical protein
MDASPALGHRFHPERPVLLAVFALFVAVLTGFVLGVLATAGLHDAPGPSPYPMMPATTSGLPGVDDIRLDDGNRLELRHERTELVPRS